MKKKLYRKALSRAPLAVLRRKAHKLKSLAYLSFVFSFLFLLLINPFSYLEVLKNFFNSPRETRFMISKFPEFIKVFPKELEGTAFSFFDWTELQLNSWPVFAWGNDSWSDKEAGQSALAEITKIDLATLNFSIEITKLELNEMVTSNVDPNNSREYKIALEEGVAHAEGSAFPGQGKLVYIFGHSTDGLWNVEAYNAIFYQINDLDLGDQLTLHLGEDSFNYRIIAKDVIKSQDIDFVNDKKDQDLLILQTCWPPGTSWQRLFITAEPF